MEKKQGGEDSEPGVGVSQSIKGRGLLCLGWHQNQFHVLSHPGYHSQAQVPSTHRAQKGNVSCTTQKAKGHREKAPRKER